MPDNASTPGAVELDAEGKQLQLQAEKAKYLEAIAKSQQAATDTKTPSLASLLPTVTDAPKGEVTVGEKAGALGAWRAHRIVDRVAAMIAEAAKTELDKHTVTRVLVVDDRSLLEGDWTARQVKATLTRLHDRVTGLKSDLEDTVAKLDEGIAKYEQEEAEAQPPQPEQTGRPSTGRGDWRRDEQTRSGTPVQPATPSAAPSATPVGMNGVLGGAVDLLGLLRTDYTLTAGSVSATPTELVTLTAGRLAGKGIAVEADLFSTLPASPSVHKFTAIAGTRNKLVEMLWKVQAKLAPVDAELAAINSRIAGVETEWAAAVADKKGEKTGEVLRATGDGLARQAQRREKAAGPARTAVAGIVSSLAEIDASVASLLQAPEGGEAPLFTAARRERLDSSLAQQHPVSHVLYVSLDSLSADTITRRSILGASGVIRFLSAGNASWLLLDAGAGTVLAGEQKHLADLVTLSLSDGGVQYDDTAAELTSVDTSKTIKDPLVLLEGVARWFVLALVVLLVVLGVVALLRLALG